MPNRAVRGGIPEHLYVMRFASVFKIGRSADPTQRVMDFQLRSQSEDQTSHGYEFLPRVASFCNIPCFVPGDIQLVATFWNFGHKEKAVHAALGKPLEGTSEIFTRTLPVILNTIGHVLADMGQQETLEDRATRWTARHTVRSKLVNSCTIPSAHLIRRVMFKDLDINMPQFRTLLRHLRWRRSFAQDVRVFRHADGKIIYFRPEHYPAELAEDVSARQREVGQGRGRKPIQIGEHCWGFWAYDGKWYPCILQRRKSISGRPVVDWLDQSGRSVLHLGEVRRKRPFRAIVVDDQ